MTSEEVKSIYLADPAREAIADAFREMAGVFTANLDVPHWREILNRFAKLPLSVQTALMSAATIKLQLRLGAREATVEQELSGLRSALETLAAIKPGQAFR